MPLVSSRTTALRTARALQTPSAPTTKRLRVLVEALHPAQVHFFRFAIELLQSQGHEVLVITREKDVTIDLIKQFGWNYRCLSRRRNGHFGMAIELMSRYWQLLKLARQFRPDVMVARTGVTIGLIGALLRIPRLVQDDTEHAKLQRAIGLPFATRIITGSGYLGEHGTRQFRYKGQSSQAYLHPDYFHPKTERLVAAGIDPRQPYIVLRTVSWEAAHDAGMRGIGEEGLKQVVTRLSQYGRVIISTEGRLPDSLKEYRNPLAAQDMHTLLAHCKLYIGEGGTMAAEAAVLGKPSIFCSQLRCGFLLALEEEYDLLYNFNEFERGLIKAEELLQDPEVGVRWRQKQQHLMDESDDIPAFIVDHIKELAHA